MSELRLKLREAPRFRVDLSALTPDRLAGLSAEQIGSIELPTGNLRLRTGELFSVEGDDASDIVIEGACDRLDRIGAAMKSGRIRVLGDAGDYLGAGMRGGASR